MLHFRPGIVSIIMLRFGLIIVYIIMLYEFFIKKREGFFVLLGGREN